MSVGLIALLDDIAGILDDVASMTHKAASKTAGVVADDLAVNAGQVTGSPSDRELPIVWSVAKGSFWNKVILVPTVLAISYFAPPVLLLMLILGGLYLSYEGAEKVLHFFGLIHDEEDEDSSNLTEKEKIRAAIKTDFVLSIEIIVIAMSELVGQSFLMQAIALSIVGLVMTVGVYGFVALIVRADDIGFWMLRKPGETIKKIGTFIIDLMPKVMRFLTVAGTLAMFLVGGSIIIHNVEFVHHATEFIVNYWSSNYIPSFITEMVLAIAIGFFLGSAVIAAKRFIKN